MDSDVLKFFGLMLSLGLAGAGTYCAVLVVNAVAARIRGAGPRDVSPDELEYLRDRAEQVEGLAERVAELETRLDFAERMLTGGPAPERHDTPAGSV